MLLLTFLRRAPLRRPCAPHTLRCPFAAAVGVSVGISGRRRRRGWRTRCTARPWRWRRPRPRTSTPSRPPALPASRTVSRRAFQKTILRYNTERSQIPTMLPKAESRRVCVPFLRRSRLACASCIPSSFHGCSPQGSRSGRSRRRPRLRPAAHPAAAHRPVARAKAGAKAGAEAVEAVVRRSARPQLTTRLQWRCEAKPRHSSSPSHASRMLRTCFAHASGLNLLTFFFSSFSFMLCLGGVASVLISLVR